MSQFTYLKKPNFVGDGKDAYDANNIVASSSGWVYNPTGEVIVACRGLTTKATDQTDINTPPTFTAAVSYSALAAMVTGDILTVTLTASEAVTVVDVPTIAVNVHGTVRQASYDAGTSTGTSIKFKYTVVAGDVATAGQVAVATTAVGGNFADVLAGSGGASNVPAPTFVAPDASAISMN